jgi:MATE family multidrug resistance protein
VPLLGIVDTAVIGNTGSVADLGAIALGALVFSFVYWSFGFLRMGTTGFTAQASGAGDTAEVRATLGRALLLASGIGVSLIALQRPIASLALALLGAGAEVEALTRSYYDVRIWGAPATLGTFAVLGLFVGLGKTRHLLVTQILLNGLNIGLDLVFAGLLGWGVEGIALGTVIAEWTTLGGALLLAVSLLRAEHTDTEAFWPWERIADRAHAAQTLGANADIMVRTLFLLLGFAWFTNKGAGFGDEVLAANHVLLQLISLSAYLLDGYAHATETFVGRAVGAGRLGPFDQAVRSATELAAVSAVVLAVLVLGLGPGAIRILTDLDPVRAVANAYLSLTAVYVVVSFAAFQLDGVFIGATATRDMRNASILSCLAFIGLSMLLIPRWANLGLWISFVFYVVVRAVALGARYPRIRASLGGD